MQGRSLRDGGCTEEDSPYREEDLVAERSHLGLVEPRAYMSPRPPPSLTAKAPDAALIPLPSCRVQTVKVPMMFGPNITSTNTTRDQIGGWSSAGSNLSRGALSTTWINNDGPRAQSSYRNGYYHMISLDAKGSSSVYGGSSSVQPASLRLLPCIKI